MFRRDRAAFLALLAIAAVGSALAQTARPAEQSTTARVLCQPSMNVFRRFEVPAERMYEFYGDVLGFEQLSTLNVGNGGGVARFQAGAQELKLTRRVGNRSYESGGVRAATGLRLLTFSFADEQQLAARFARHGLPAPQFTDYADGRRSALVQDPDGQDVELVVLPAATPEQLARVEVGLTVAHMARSRDFYRGFVGLEELPPVDDERFGTRKYSYPHGAPTISLRSFGSSGRCWRSVAQLSGSYLVDRLPVGWQPDADGRARQELDAWRGGRAPVDSGPQLHRRLLEDQGGQPDLGAGCTADHQPLL